MKIAIKAGAAVAALLLWVKTGNRAQTERLTALREEALPLERQRETLLRQLSGLKISAETESALPATEELLVTDVDVSKATIIRKSKPYTSLRRTTLYE